MTQRWIFDRYIVMLIIAMDWENFSNSRTKVEEGYFCKFQFWPGVFLQFPMFRGVFLQKSLQFFSPGHAYTALTQAKRIFSHVDREVFIVDEETVKENR